MSAAAAASAAPSPAPSLGSLPLDLLADIISHLPLRPRFTVLALVSRRLLLAVRHSVRSGLHRRRDVITRLSPAARSHLTNLASLILSRPNLRAPPPASVLSRLRSVRIENLSDPTTLQIFDRFSALTSLELEGEVLAPQLTSVLQQHAASVTSLKLRCMCRGPGYSGMAAQTDPAKVVTLPNLMSLHCSSAQALTFVHAPALTHLHAEASELTAPILLRLPTHRLASLSLSFRAPFTELNGWMLSLTQLKRLELDLPYISDGHYAPDVYHLLQHSPALTSLSFTQDCVESFDQLAAALAPHTKLRSIRPLPLRHTQFVASLGSRLTTLELSDGETVPNLAGLLADHVTNLQKLTLYPLFLSLLRQGTGGECLWPLPRLRKLVLLLNHPTKEDILPRLPRIISAYPSLQSLHIYRGHLTPEWVNARGWLAALFAHCAQHCPDVCVYFTNTGAAVAEEVARLGRQYPWLTIETFVR